MKIFVQTLEMMFILFTLGTRCFASFLNQDIWIQRIKKFSKNALKHLVPRADGFNIIFWNFILIFIEIRPKMVLRGCWGRCIQISWLKNYPKQPGAQSERYQHHHLDSNGDFHWNQTKFDFRGFLRLLNTKIMT